MSVVKPYLSYAPLLRELHKRCFERPWSENEFKSLLSLPTTLLWVSEEGFLLCSKVADEMEILTLGVLPEHRRRHIASKFLSEMIDYATANAVRYIFLEVSVRNQAAIKLYQQFGFEKAGIRPDYYQTPQGPADALCLRRQIIF